MTATLRSVGVIAIVTVLLVSPPVRGTSTTLAYMADGSSQQAVARTASDQDLLVHYPVPGNPYSISVEAPGRVWFTMPEQNLIGRLVVTSTVDYEVVTYTVPTANSYPYDLVYASGAVWFTEQEGNKIGRLDASLGTFDEFIIPTPSSTPTGIDVLAGVPTHVWFTERSGDRLGHLVYTDTATTAMTEHALPDAYIGIGAKLEDISIHTANKVWFTAPGLGYIGSHNAGLYTLRGIPNGGEPWSVQVAAAGLPVWFTDRAGGRIGVYITTTISNFLMYALAADGGNPSSLVLMGDGVWFTEELGQRVSRLSPSSASVASYGVGPGMLAAIDADSSGALYFCERDAMAIGQWRPPYFRYAYLPIAMRG